MSSTFLPSLIQRANRPVLYRATNLSVGPSVDTEVTLIDQTVPAGLLGTDGGVRCTIIGDWLNNGASSRQYTLRFYAGATKIYDGTGSALAVSATRRPFWCQTVFANRGSVSTNQMSGECGLGGVVAPTTGFGLPTSSGTGNSIIGAISSDQVAVDTSVAWAFKASLQLSFAESTLDMRIAEILLEVV